MSRNMKVIRRAVIAMVLGLAIGFGLSEISFQLLKETNRSAQTVELVIPDGTADAVSQGKTPPSLPSGMSFVVGDVLEVENRDSADHQLGPLWIPAGTTASLALTEEENYIFTCTFSPSNYFGLDVKEPVTFWTRLGGLFFAGVPMGAILMLYSFVLWPLPAKNVPVLDA